MEPRKFLLINLLILISFGYSYSQDFQWVDHITDGSGTVFSNDIALDASGNVYIVGGYTGNPDFDPGTGMLNLGSASGQSIYFAKYSNSGVLIWAKALNSIAGEDAGLGIALDNQSNIYITGKFETDNLDFDPGVGTAILNSGSGADQDIFVAKYNSNGNYQWAFNIGGNGSGCGNDITVDNSGNVYVTGEFTNSGTTTPVDFDPGPGFVLLDSQVGKAFYAKYNTSGSLLWAWNVGGGSAIDKGFSIAVDGSSNVYITGAFSGTSDFNPSGSSPILNSANGGAFVAKYNSSGNYVWGKQVPGQGSEFGTGIEVDGSGNVFVTVTTSSTNTSDVLLRKYSSSGNTQWTASIESSNAVQSGKLALDGSGNVYITGIFQGANVDFNPLGSAVNLSATNSDLYLVKYNTNGLVQWARDVDASTSDFIRGTSLTINSSDIFVAGNFRGTGDFNPCRGIANLTSSGTDVFFGKYSLNSLMPTTINGPDAVCATGSFIFSLDQVPTGATVFWTTSPANILSPSSATSQTFNTNAIGSGTVTITANINNGQNCGNAVISQQSIRVGAFSTSEVSVTGTSMICPGNVYYYNAIVPGGHQPGYTYSWTYPSNWTVPSGVTGSQQIGLQVPTYNPAYGTVQVSVTNECDASPFNGLTVFPGFGCGSYFTFFPNPADEKITLSSTAINQRTFEQSTTTEEPVEYLIELYSRSGKRVESIKTKAEEVDVPTAKLPDGLYTLKIFYLKETIEHSIIIKH